LLDGDERMRQRPIGPLAEALESLGIQVEHPLKEGYPPLRLTRRSPPPGRVSVDISRSSQFASGLLLLAPRLADGLLLELSGQVVSLPYLRMTTQMMERAGARVSWQAPNRIQVRAGAYDFAKEAAEQVIEPDWSTAAFVLAAARIAGLRVKIPDLPSAAQSLQGDALFASMLEELDRPGRHEFDLTRGPDLIAPLVAAALLADGPTRIKGAAHTRIKESDRIAVLVGGLRQLGAEVVEHPDGLELTPLPERPDEAVRIDPAGDHRMAMAFGLLSLRWPAISVLDPGCVSKSYPSFWDMLARIRAAKQGGAP
jgi:3-phosphoshikimate 1-carboxyvinyltransferase